MTSTTASTTESPPITFDAIRRALEAMPRLEPNHPIRLTRKECQHLAGLLGLQTDRKLDPVGPSSLAGVPIEIVADDAPIARIFGLRERIRRDHFLLRQGLGASPNLMRGEP